MQWIPQTSEIFQNFEKSVEYFGEFDSSLTLLIEHTEGENLLAPENMDILYQVFNQTANNISLIYKKEKFIFDDLCTRLYPGFPVCTDRLTGVLGFFEFDPQQWSSQSKIQQVLNDYQLELPVCVQCFNSRKHENTQKKTTKTSEKKVT